MEHDTMIFWDPPNGEILVANYNEIVVRSLEFADGTLLLALRDGSSVDLLEAPQTEFLENLLDDISACRYVNETKTIGVALNMVSMPTDDDIMNLVRFMDANPYFTHVDFHEHSGEASCLNALLYVYDEMTTHCPNVKFTASPVAPSMTWQHFRSLRPHAIDKWHLCFSNVVDLMDMGWPIDKVYIKNGDVFEHSSVHNEPRQLHCLPDELLFDIDELLRDDDTD